MAAVQEPDGVLNKVMGGGVGGTEMAEVGWQDRQTDCVPTLRARGTLTDMQVWTEARGGPGIAATASAKGRPKHPQAQAAGSGCA